MVPLVAFASLRLRPPAGSPPPPSPAGRDGFRDRTREGGIGRFATTAIERISAEVFPDL